MNDAKGIADSFPVKYYSLLQESISPQLNSPSEFNGARGASGVNPSEIRFAVTGVNFTG